MVAVKSFQICDYWRSNSMRRKTIFCAAAYSEFRNELIKFLFQ